MKTNRLEAFSDGVLAIIITIMVLELEAPEDTSFDALIPRIPIFISYLLSFIYVGIYWNNHHHLFQVTKKVNGKILWANLHLLFWLSLIPFTTSWLGENHLEAIPLIFYGITLLMSGVAFTILQMIIIKEHSSDFILTKILGKRNKEKISLFIYVVGLLASFYFPWLAVACYVIVAFIWLVPNKQIEISVN
ncbi:TMEM175 family protein [Psychroserpens sp. MEBiC05023]